MNVIILGASGDLASRKVFPALFSLFSRDLLPDKINFFGFSRSRYTDDEFRNKIQANLTCRYTPDHSCADYIKKFLNRCYYCQGNYDSPDSYKSLSQLLLDKNQGNESDNLFYFSVPPMLYLTIADGLKNANLVSPEQSEFWSRMIMEKPFGHDRASSDELTEKLGNAFSEDQTYRIDHYLGKEMIQNLLILRFANQIFKPLWNHEFIEKIEIRWAENLGINERGGYFDNYGIIRDVIQNHLFQMLALTAMEEPSSLDPEAIRDRKVELLQCITPLNPEDTVIGQYTQALHNGVRVSGYRDDPSVPDDSLTPTFAKIRLTINNSRWNCIPFIITAGKGLEKSATDIKITFKKTSSNIFCSHHHCPPPNELIFRVQPQEGLHFNIVTKIPGTKMDFISRELDLSYDRAFAGTVMPDAYENLLLDVVKGDKTLFIRKDELQAAWDILTPLLHYFENEKTEPEFYPFGSQGPASATDIDNDQCQCQRIRRWEEKIKNKS